MSDYPRTRVTERIPRKDLYDTRLPQVKTQEVPPESNTLRGTTAYVNEARTVVSANIPMYPQITPNDVTQAFGLQFLQEYEPQIYQHYNDILNGVVKSSMGVQKKRDILKKGIKTEEPSPKELAQIYYNRVIGAAIWKYLMYTVKVRVTNKDGESSLQDFDFPLFQYNYPDEKVFETGNPVDKDYSDNGVIAIPLQMTLNPIFYELQTQLQRSQYFEIEDGIIDIDLSGIENDMNASGSINIIYDPAGTNQVCSWDDLMNMQNANFRLQFGIANQQTNFRIVIDNQIGNDGVFQCVRNNAGGQSSAQIVNSAGIIFLLDSKRTQNNQNPALAKVQNYKISRLSDLNLIIPDGFAKLSAKLRTTGQNGDSNLYPILTRLGMGVLAGDFQEGGGSGGDGSGGSSSGEPNDDVNAYGQGVTNIQTTNAPFQGSSFGKAKRGIKGSYINVIKILMAANRRKKMMRRLDRYRTYEYQTMPNKAGKKAPSNAALDHLQDILGAASVEFSNEQRLLQYIYKTGGSAISANNLSTWSPLFSTKVFLSKSPFGVNFIGNLDLLNLEAAVEYASSKGYAWAHTGLGIFERKNLDRNTDIYPSKILAGENNGSVSGLWTKVGDQVYVMVYLPYVYNTKEMLTTMNADFIPPAFSVSQSIAIINTGSTNADTSRQNTESTISIGCTPNIGLCSNEVPGATNASALYSAAFMYTTQQNAQSQRNVPWKKILNIAQKGLAVVTMVVDKIRGYLGAANTTDYANIVSYGFRRIPPIAFPVVTDAAAVTEYPNAEQISEISKIALGYNTLPSGATATDNEFIESYNSRLNLFGTYKQFLVTPSATRFVYNFNGLLSYQFYILHALAAEIVFTSRNYYITDTGSTMYQPIVHVNYSVQVYATLAQNLVYKEGSDEIDIAQIFDLCVPVNTPQVQQKDITLEADWNEVNSNMENSDTVVIASPSTKIGNAFLATDAQNLNSQGAVDHIGLYQGSINVNQEFLATLPETLPTVSNGEPATVTLNSETSVLLFPVVNISISVIPLKEHRVINVFNSTLGYDTNIYFPIVYSIVPGNSIYKNGQQCEFGIKSQTTEDMTIDNRLEVLPLVDTSKATFLTMSTLEFGIKEVDPAGNIRNTEEPPTPSP